MRSTCIVSSSISRFVSVFVFIHNLHSFYLFYRKPQRSIMVAGLTSSSCPIFGMRHILQQRNGANCAHQPLCPNYCKSLLIWPSTQLDRQKNVLMMKSKEKSPKTAKHENVNWSIKRHVSKRGFL